MKKGLRRFLIIVSLPLIFAVGADLFLLINDIIVDETGPKGLSTPGYLWTHISPESYQWAADSAGPEIWPWITFVLTQKSLVVGCVFASFFYILTGILMILGIDPFRYRTAADTNYASRADAIVGRKPRSAFKYKRKK